jgi:hypothetical protein
MFKDFFLQASRKAKVYAEKQDLDGYYEKGSSCDSFA